MNRKRAVGILSPFFVLLLVAAMLLLPQAPIGDHATLGAPSPFGASVAWADSTDPANGGGREPAHDPDHPAP